MKPLFDLHGVLPTNALNADDEDDLNYIVSGRRRGRPRLDRLSSKYKVRLLTELIAHVNHLDGRDADYTPGDSQDSQDSQARSRPTPGARRSATARPPLTTRISTPSTMRK